MSHFTSHGAERTGRVSAKSRIASHETSNGPYAELTLILGDDYVSFYPQGASVRPTIKALETMIETLKELEAQDRHAKNNRLAREAVRSMTSDEEDKHAVLGA